MLSHVEKNAVEWLLLYSAAACGVNPFSSRCSAGFLVACKYIHTYSQQKLKTNAITSKRLKLIFFEGIFCFLLLRLPNFGAALLEIFSKGNVQIILTFKANNTIFSYMAFFRLQSTVIGRVDGPLYVRESKKLCKMLPPVFLAKWQKKPQRNSNSYSSTVTTTLIIPIPNCTFIKKKMMELFVFMQHFLYSVYTLFCQYFHHLNLQCCRCPMLFISYLPVELIYFFVFLHKQNLI